MSQISRTASRGEQSADLAIETSKSIGQIAKLLKNRQSNKLLKRFLGRLMVHCLFIGDHVDRIKPALGTKTDFLTRILDLFESLIADHILSGDPIHPYPRQRALNRSWETLRTQKAGERLEFVDQCLKVESLLVEEINEAFNEWEEDVVAAYPDDADCPPPTKERDEPSYRVWSAAQSLFKALSSSTKCACAPKHEVGATLRLGTYRKPDPDDTNDFDTFLSLQQYWQEAHFHTVRDNVVRFVVDGQAQPPQNTMLNYKPMRVRGQLCKHIQEKQKFSDRLEFKVERDILWKLRSKKSTASIDHKKPTVSLQQFVKEGSQYLTDKTKRILAVLLSYAVLHLHGTPWLEQNWDSSKIIFFKTSSSIIPLRPFIQTQLIRENVNLDPVLLLKENDSECPAQDDLDPDDLDPDDLDPEDDMDPDHIEHPFPTLLTLAIMLMELYTAKPFRELAKNCGIGLPEGPDSRTRLLDVASVFDEYKREIPRNSQFYHAIQNCLDPRAWEDNQGQKLDNSSLRFAIYREIIRPLEDELCDAFDFITIEELDQIADTIDFGSWGQTIQNQQEEADPEVPSHAMNGVALQKYQQFITSQVPMQYPSFTAWNGDSLGRLCASPMHGQRPHDASIYNCPKFYDDERSSEGHSPANRQNYLNWRKKYKDVYSKFIDGYIKDPNRSPVKIAILDSGVDDTHNSLDSGQIVAKHNWTTSKFKKSTRDVEGHGTFTASLLIDFAPDAELYVAKIAEKELSPPDVVAKAIMSAVDDWKVDIISMSFGYPTNQTDGYKELETAILYAHSKNVLMFAAASNGGANQDRAYPARDPHVVCIHSTDSDGNRSRFSPTALSHDINLATIGEAVQSAWPVNLCDPNFNPDCIECKSGTSYATPIAVGIAAFLMQYVRLHLPDDAHLLKRQSKMKEVLLKIAEKTQKSSSRDGYHYITLSLFSDNLFGKDKQYIDVTLCELLNN